VKKLDFIFDEKGVVRQAANFTTLHFWLKKPKTLEFYRVSYLSISLKL